MQRLDHRLELGDLLAAVAGAAVGVVRREVADGVVAPVVRHALGREVRLGDDLVHREQLDGGDAEVPEVVDDGRGGQAGVRPAQLLGDPVVQLREALDVQLVDDGVGPLRLRRAVVAPVEVVDHDDGLRHERGRVALVAGRRLGRDGLGVVARLGPDVAVEGVVELDLARHRERVRVEQQLGRVEPKAPARLPRAVGAVAVALARLDPGDRAVPDAERVLGETVPRLDDPVGGVVEEAHVDAPRLGRVDGEVGGLLAPGRSERLVLARPDRGGVVVVHPAIVPNTAAYVARDSH